MGNLVRVVFLVLLISCLSCGRRPYEDNRHYKDGIEYSKQANVSAAWDAFSRAVEDEADHAPALHSLGTLAVIHGQFDDAIRYHGLAKAADPTSLPPLALLHQNKVPCSGLSDIFWVASFAKKSLYDAPQDVNKRFEVHIEMGTQLEDSGLIDLAIEHFHTAATIRPQDLALKLRNGIMVPVVYDSKEAVQGSRHQLEQSLVQLRVEAKNLTLPRLDQLAMPGTFYIVYQGYNDAPVMEAIQSTYAQLYPRLVNTGLALPSPAKETETATGGDRGVGSPRRNKKIRVGFVSAYFRRHSVCKLFCGIIHHLPRDQFEVVVFSSTSDKDSLTQYVGEHAKLVEMPHGFLLTNRQTAIDESLDVVVFTDIGMDTPTTMWASGRIAPIQVVTWGHPVTTGLSNIDYFVTSDLYEGAEGQDRFTEQLVRFDSLSMHFLPHPRENQTRARQEAFRDKHHLPSNRPIIACPQSLPKFHPDFDRVLKGIMEALPEAVLVIVYSKDKTMWKSKLEARMSRSLGPTVINQVRFLPSLPPSDFQMLLSLSVLLLDPFPFGGGVTSLEAFAYCKPVVTLPSRQTVPTLTAGMLQAMGLTKALTATTERDFIQRAVQVVRESPFRQHVERQICGPSGIGVVYENKGAVDEWAAFLARVVKSSR